MKEISLSPIKESSEDYEAIERAIIRLLREEIYIPLIRGIGPSAQNVLKNAYDDLMAAIQTGRITYYRGQFSGRFSASISKELKRLGAEWDRKQGSWKIPQSSLPPQIRDAIRASFVRLQEKISDIDQKLQKILPEKISDNLKIERHFDSALWKVERQFQSSIKGISVAAQVTPEMRKRISDEWQNNMKLGIKDWAESEIKSLRSDLQKSVFAGIRYENVVSVIQKSYGASQSKAKFLARQETSLLMTKFKETRYQSAGVMEYRWRCVAGSKNHPVRPWHKALEGRVFRWDNPPVTSKPGEPIRRNNPGQDFNCRCLASPIVRFGK